MDFNINVQDVHNTGENLKNNNNNFAQAVENIYSIINTAKANAWQSREADAYYQEIMNYKHTLDEISEGINYWQNKVNNIADNFETASNNIQNNINNL